MKTGVNDGDFQTQMTNNNDMRYNPWLMINVEKNFNCR